MANLSDAFGAIEFKANDIDVLGKVVGIFERFVQAGEYNTVLGGNFQKKDINVLKHNLFSYETSFDGTGRWAFSSNAENALPWLKSSISYAKDLTDAERQEIISFLEENEYSIYYDFVDYEPGCDLLYKAKVEVVHKAGEPLDSCYGAVTNEVNYEVTAENMRRLNFADDYVE